MNNVSACSGREGFIRPAWAVFLLVAGAGLVVPAGAGLAASVMLVVPVGLVGLLAVCLGGLATNVVLVDPVGAVGLLVVVMTSAVLVVAVEAVGLEPFKVAGLRVVCLGRGFALVWVPPFPVVRLAAAVCCCPTGFALVWVPPLSVVRLAVAVCCCPAGFCSELLPVWPFVAAQPVLLWVWICSELLPIWLCSE